MENSQSIGMTNNSFHSTSNSKGMEFIDDQAKYNENMDNNEETLNKNEGNSEIDDNEINKMGNQQINRNSHSVDTSEQKSRQTETPPLPLNSTIPTSTSKLKIGPHALATKWTIWFLQGRERIGANSSKDDWLERLNPVSTVDTVENFWALFDNIRPPSALPMQSDYYFFKEGIKPQWEVPENIRGGRLLIQVDKGRMDILDTLWQELLLTLIGEQFADASKHICGAVCNIRQKGSKICLWTRNAEDETINKRIGSVMKNRCQEVIGINNCIIRVNYEEHQTKQKSSSAMKCRFTL